MNRKAISPHSFILIAALTGLALAPFGCAPTLVGQNAAVYSMGRLHARFDKNMDSVYDASVKALEALEITITEKKKDVFAARVYGKTSDEHTITIKIEPESDESTLLSIYTGVMVGSEVRSRAIYDKIRDILGVPK